MNPLKGAFALREGCTGKGFCIVQACLFLLRFVILSVNILGDFFTAVILKPKRGDAISVSPGFGKPSGFI